MNKNKIKSPSSNDRKPFAKKSLGQNFLVDQNYIDKIILALNPTIEETIIEIGPGRGALTERLVKSGASVIAIELDRNLIPLLSKKFVGYENFTLIEKDALETNFADVIKDSKPAKLVANLPYYISTAILQKLIEQRDCFSEMILMFQREVVERITAKIGNSERGFLTVMTEAYLKTEKLFDVPPNAFLPEPKVWSAIIRLKPNSAIEIVNEKLFRQIVSAAFRQKRKTIINNLKNLKISNENWSDILENAEIEATRRAESLSLGEWSELLRAFVK
jgi:16S rRNA (adenine1518-N6/adenine1519-N6)-dimethyltransferase